MNDLIGLEYGWAQRPGDGSGKTDCFQLACEVRRRLGLGDYSSRFAWVYDQFTESDFSCRHLVRWVLENGSRCATPRTGTVALLPTNAGSALGTWLEGVLLFIGPGRRVVQTPVPDGVARYFWMQP